MFGPHEYIYGIDNTRLPCSQNSPWASPNVKSGLTSLGEAEALPRPARPVTLRVRACFQLLPDWPSPQSQSFPKVKDPGCRFPLPTLFYWPEAVHLGGLLQLWVRPEPRVYTAPRIFKGRPVQHRTLLQTQRSTGPRYLSPIQSISGKPAPYNEKTTLPGALASVSRLHSFAALTV